MPRYPVVMEVKEIREDLPPPCPVHSVGDKIVIDNGCVEGKVCLPALAQILPRLYALVYGAPAVNVFTFRCPDKGKVVYEVRRDPDHWWRDARSPRSESGVKPDLP